MRDIKICVLDPRLHVFSRLKSDDVLFRHDHFITRARIARPACSPRFDLKDTKVPKLDPTLANECLDDRIKGPLDNLLGLLLREAYLVRNRTDDVFLSHSRLLLPIRQPPNHRLANDVTRY